MVEDPKSPVVADLIICVKLRLLIRSYKHLYTFRNQQQLGAGCASAARVITFHRYTQSTKSGMMSPALLFVWDDQLWTKCMRYMAGVIGTPKNAAAEIGLEKSRST